MMPKAKPTAPSNLKVNPQSQGIWSTMKNLMRQGHHHHGHPINHQFSHAHVYTLAGNPPNVVDLTTSNSNNSTATAESLASSPSTANDKSKRPWSKQSRAVRNATIQDITSNGMIRAAGVNNSAGEINISNIVQPHNSNSNAGVKRLWRGVQTMFVGCIPAHALYFSSYEAIKSMCTDHQQQHREGNHVGHDTLSPAQAMLAGTVATLLHDFVMTPMDTMKQRMQLGHYDNLRHAFASIVWGKAGEGATSTTASSTATATTMAGEGWRGLYRSFPITVMTNVPYGMIMMTTNEWLRGVLEDGLYGIHQNEEENPFHFATILLSGMGAGTIASAATAPLDRVKTRLQTQRMGMMLPTTVGSGGNGGAPFGSGVANNGNAGSSSVIMEERALAAARGEPKVCPKMAVRDVKRTLGFPGTAAATANMSCSTVVAKNSAPTTRQHSATMRPPMANTPFKTYYATPMEAFQSILQEEGPRGLFRGTLPRVALHAPSVAISWTAYEMAKDWLIWLQ
mmetsp:Transcript_4592/g.8815  ORF Transcript_4592/g.8815 Transcript_4592/m.8815 type:complete len:510 (+) Transcript_4592:699-2228(+)